MRNALLNIKTYVFASPRASKSCCPSVDIRTARSKTVILGRQQLYAVPARSTAHAALFGITPVLAVIHRCEKTGPWRNVQAGTQR